MRYRSLASVTLVVCAIACGSRWTSNAVDLPATSGVPVEVRAAKMRQTLVAVLGATPVNFSSRTDVPLFLFVEVRDLPPR